MKKFFIIIGLGLTVLSSCGSSDDLTDNTADENRIQLQSGMATTRAGLSIQSTEFDKGEQINVFLSEVVTVDQTASTKYTQPIVYVTSNTSGSMTPANSIFPYYPSNGRNVDLWACYPSRVNQNSTTFTVESDQTTKDGYKRSDMMYAAKAGILRQKEIVPITFYHKMAKVRINLTVPDGKDVSILDNSRVSITNVARTIAINPSAQYIGTTSAELTNIGSVTVSTNGSLDCSAIIVPQTVDPGYFLEIRLSNGDILNYMLPQSITFVPGTINTFAISVNEQNIKATYSVTPWDDTATAISGAISLDK